MASKRTKAEVGLSIAVLAGATFGGYVGYKVATLLIPLDWRSGSEEHAGKGQVVQGSGAAIGFITGLVLSGMLLGNVGKASRALEA